MSTDPAKRIPKSLGTDAKLYGRYTLTDVGVALGPAVLVILALQVVLPPATAIGGVPLQSLTIPLAVIAVAFGALIVFLTPPHLSSLDWLATIVRFHRGARRFTHQTATSLTQIERVHPVEGAIERSDGAVVGMVQVDPPTMALATDDEWRAVAAAFEDFCNTVVEFPIQLYSTTQDFPVESYLGQYVDRLADPDVKANPQLAELIESYIEWYARDLQARRMTIREHYVVATVAPSEVQFERESLLQKLTRLPLLGLLIEARFAPRRVEQREAMFEALEERLRHLETALRDIEGCQARRVDVESATLLVAEFWAGGPIADGDLPSGLRTRPIVGGGR